MPSTVKSLFVVLGNQLYAPQYLKDHQTDLFFMAEDRDFCDSRDFHQHKLTFYLSAMRHYARELRHHDLNLVYFEMEETKGLTYEKILKKVLTEGGLKKIKAFEIENKNTELKIVNFCKKNEIQLEFISSPGFITSRQEFKSHLEQNPKPQFQKFYEEQRQSHKILMEKTGEPLGGRYAIDDEEQLKWTKKSHTPRIPASLHDEIDMAVIHLVEKEYPENTGLAKAFWYPTSRDSAVAAFKDFCTYRLAEFGVYENALCPDEDFLFHSVLAPLLNSGLLTPAEVIKGALKHYAENPLPLNSLETYIRQVLGWREYAHGIYQNFGEDLQKSNTWKNTRHMNKNWRRGKTGVPPLDDAIQKANRLAYNHHIERASVLLNMMTLSEIHPHEAYRWFTEMHVDSADWAVVPHVYGAMAEPSYLGNSEHWFKISDYPKESWADEVDGLYWRFVEKHRESLAQHPCMSGATKNLEKITSERKAVLWQAADGFLTRNTVYP
jgi:deoxyribodipyrimidine photolyase-related protein